MIWLIVLLGVLLGYLLGSIPVGLWVCRLYGVDIRTVGSGPHGWYQCLARGGPEGGHSHDHWRCDQGCGSRLVDSDALPDPLPRTLPHDRR